MIDTGFGYTLHAREVSDSLIKKTIELTVQAVEEDARLRRRGLKGLEAFVTPVFRVSSNYSHAGRPSFYREIDINMSQPNRKFTDAENLVDGFRLQLQASMPDDVRDTLEKTYSVTYSQESSRPQVSRIEPDIANGMAAQRMTYEGLKSLGHKHPLRWANPGNTDRVIDQKNLFAHNPQQYAGIFNDGNLVAFMKTNEWFFGDQVPFGKNIFERIENTKRYKNGERRVAGAPLGIFALEVDRRLATFDRFEAVNELLDLATFIADTDDEPKEICIPLHNRDDSWAAIKNHGFEDTGKKGRLVGIRQKLFVRDAETQSD